MPEIKGFFSVKADFFSHQRNLNDIKTLTNFNKPTPIFSINNVEQLNASPLQLPEFGTIAYNLFSVEQECDQLYALFCRITDEDKQEISNEQWLFLAFCLSALIKYHRGYGNKDGGDKHDEEANQYLLHYQKVIQYIELGHTNSVRKDEEEKDNERAFAKYILKTILDWLKSILTIPLHLSKIRDEIAKKNLWRLFFTFCRLSLLSTCQLLSNVDLERAINVLESPAATFRVLSVVLFSARFLLNVILIIKHTFFPSDAEKADERWTRTERFVDELTKRYWQDGNDVVWMLANSFSNFAPFFGISAPVASLVTITFLLFDVAWLVVAQQVQEARYNAKLAEYDAVINDLQMNPEKYPGLKIDKYIATNLFQRNELLIEKEASKAFFNFNICAAILIVVGFSIALTVTPVGGAIVGFAFCTFAIGMYLSAGSFKEMYKKDLQLKDSKINIILLAAGCACTKKDHDDATIAFAIELAKNTILPTLMLGLFAASWQVCLIVAAAVAVGYVGYKVYASYQDFSKPKAVNDDHDEMDSSGSDYSKESDDYDYVGSCMTSFT